MYDGLRGKEKPREDSKLLFIIILRILIDECDRASRIEAAKRDVTRF